MADPRSELEEKGARGLKVGLLGEKKCLGKHAKASSDLLFGNQCESDIFCQGKKERTFQESFDITDSSSPGKTQPAKLAWNTCKTSTVNTPKSRQLSRLAPSTCSYPPTPPH